MLQSISAGVTIKDITHAALLAKKNAGTLVKGQLYRIIDFRTRHLIPNTAVYNEGPVEPLILMAIAANKLAIEAYSDTYPQDIIHYELEDSAGWGGDRGRIFFRHNTEIDIGIYAPEDWRSIKYRRWETSPGSGIYTVLTNNGGAYLDRYMFNDSPLAATCYCNHIEWAELGGAPPHMLNSIFGQSMHGNNIDRGMKNITAAAGFNDNNIDRYFHDNTIGISFNDNTIGKYFQRNIVSGNFGYNTILPNIFDCTFGDNFQNNKIFAMDSVEGITFGDNIAYKCLNNQHSDFSITANITGLSAIDIGAEGSWYAGIINVASSNATENINQILNMPFSGVTEAEFEIRPEADLTLTITGTAFAAVNANGQVLLDVATVALAGNKKESAVFRKETITNGNGTFTVAKLIAKRSYL